MKVIKLTTGGRVINFIPYVQTDEDLARAILELKIPFQSFDGQTFAFYSLNLVDITKEQRNALFNLLLNAQFEDPSDKRELEALKQVWEYVAPTEELIDEIIKKYFEKTFGVKVVAINPLFRGALKSQQERLYVIIERVEYPKFKEIKNKFPYSSGQGFIIEMLEHANPIGLFGHLTLKAPSVIESWKKYLEYLKQLQEKIDP